MEKVRRQMKADQADVTFSYHANELGCVEVGLVDNGPKGTKELNEMGIKTPKMLKCFGSRLAQQYDIPIECIKTSGMIISGKL
jgi:hypothetical protein